jgi:hypothetical protein
MAIEDLDPSKTPKKRRKVVPETPGADVTEPLSPEEIQAREEEAARDAGGAIVTAEPADSSTPTPAVESGEVGESSSAGSDDQPQSDGPDGEDSPNESSEPADSEDSGLDTVIAAAFIEQMVAEDAVMIEKVVDICARHYAVAKAARRHSVASAFQAVSQITQALAKKIEGVEYWKVQA